MLITDIIKHFKEQFKCDSVRISVAGDTMFLVIGENRNTKDDIGQWVQVLEDGTESLRDWDYVDEKVIASGKTITELIESANEYEMLCGMIMAEYLTELTNVKQFMGTEINDK